MRAVKLFLIVLLAFTAAANAGTIGPGDIVTIQYLSPSGTTASGIYVGPYNFLVNGSPMSLICNDPYQSDRINPGNQWSALVSDYSDLSQTRFGSRPNAVELYGLIGVLDTDMFASGPASYAGDHTALLNFVDSTFAMTADAPARQAWAQTQLASSPDLSRMLWFTPVNSQGQVLASGFQELGGQSPVPEPAGYLVLGGGLMLLGFWAKIKNRRERLNT